MLAVLCATLFFTAMVVQNTYTPVNNLKQTAKTLETNLHKKEEYVSAALSDQSNFNQFKHLADSPQNALKFIQSFTTERGIWFITLTNGHLSFWSGVKVIPPYPTAIKNGSSFRKEPNGYY